jgi:hypothetical protein
VLPWQLVRQETGADSACAILRLEHGPQTQAFWPHVFVLELTVRVGAASLSLGLTCRNVGADAFSFHAAMHSYFRVHDLPHCRLSGLQGLRYQDALDHQDKLQAGDVEWGTGDLDRVYTRVPGPLLLSGLGRDGGGASHDRRPDGRRSTGHRAAAGGRRRRTGGRHARRRRPVLQPRRGRGDSRGLRVGRTDAAVSAGAVRRSLPPPAPGPAYTLAHPRSTARA